jgi:hypothetical protein
VRRVILTLLLAFQFAAFAPGMAVPEARAVLPSPEVSMAVASAPAIASWGPGRLDVFVRGLDNALWHRAHHHGEWGSWSSLGGNFEDDPAAVSWEAGRIDVFVLGVDNAIWHIAHQGGGWGSWGSLGGTFTSSPAVASWEPGRLDVVARGADNTLQHIAFHGAWGSWSSLGGSLTSKPSITTPGAAPRPRAAGRVASSPPHA